MHHAIVEGEPGIFPDPIARLMRAVGGLFRRDEERPPAPEPPSDQGPAGDDDQREPEPPEDPTDRD
jgi:hypothetical protein